ncbi:DUF1254 domain-containing protein [Microbulbifer aggregans]|uniref:DUF1254 domain-containing protein n=1 Tax=Microbulbifer aggregans TaxID=1769779 RepID=UPI001CFDEACD|nr:DUF1254 domain-containing protein [Microbulbifer aggregans]
MMLRTHILEEDTGLRLLFALTLLLAGLLSNPISAQSWPTSEETQKIAEEGFIYGLPLVMDYAVMYEFTIDKDSGQYKAPFNTLSNSANVFTYKDTAVVTPNSDTPYSMLWMDLRTEPMVISVPAIDKKRYYSIQLVDGNTFNYGYIGSRATGNGAGNYMIAGPGWQGEKPPGINQVFVAGSDFSQAIFRTQLFNPEDIQNVRDIQAQYKAQPLSSFLGKPAPPAAEKIDFPKIDKQSMQSDFFTYLDFVLKLIPANPDDKEILEKLARIGVGPGKKVSITDLPEEQRKAIAQGMSQAQQKIARAVDSLGSKVNGWNIAAAFGDRAFYNGNWLLRAAAASAGIYGNDAEEATYPMTRSDGKGTPLDGSKHKYTLTFAKGELPPVNAFWSVTMYDGKTQLLIKNPINRYLINSPMLPDMKKNDDGSVTIYIQKDSPGADLKSNWLPAPDGPIYLAMRLYWPKTDPPSVLPPGDGTWKPPAIEVAD